MPVSPCARDQMHGRTSTSESKSLIWFGRQLRATRFAMLHDSGRAVIQTLCLCRVGPYSFPSSCKDKSFCMSHRFLIEFLSLNILHILFVVRVFDRWTCNQTCFNAARALKPLNNGEAKTPHSVEFPPGTTVPGCDFCSPLDYTAAGELFS